MFVANNVFAKTLNNNEKYEESIHKCNDDNCTLYHREECYFGMRKAIIHTKWLEAFEQCARLFFI